MSVLRAPRFFTHFKFCHHFFISDLIEKKVGRDKGETPQKRAMAILEPFLGDQNGHSEIDPRAYVLGQREGETKTER